MTNPHELNPDPLYGDYVEVRQIRAGVTLQGRPVLSNLVSNSSWRGHGGPACGTQGETPERWVCTRPEGHPDHWKHVASNGVSILEVWGGAPRPRQVQVQIPTVDDSGTDVVPPVDLRIGGVYRVHSQAHVVQLVGGIGDYVRPDNALEVLDLTDRTFRVVDGDTQFVASDYVLTLDDLKFVVDTTADLRARVKDEAVASKQRRGWCQDGLDRALEELGIDRHEPEQFGSLVIRIPYRAPSSLGTSEVRALFEKEVLTLGDVQKFTLGENEHDIELVPAQAQIRIENVERR